MRSTCTREEIIVSQSAASGDLRNVIETVYNIPTGRASRSNFVINDHNQYIVFRNILVLLITMYGNTEATSIDAIIHLTYSCRITFAHRELLSSAVVPQVETIIKTAIQRDPAVLLSKTFGQSRPVLRVILQARHWMELGRLLERLACNEPAGESRRSVVLARRDHLDRFYTSLHAQPHWRVAVQSFKDTGLLLPFGAKVDDFVCQNASVTLCYVEEEWANSPTGLSIRTWENGCSRILLTH